MTAPCRTHSQPSTAKGLNSHKGPGGRTYLQLRNEACERGIKGRSSMNKAQLEAALAR